jgi:hypothetical protein
VNGGEPAVDRQRWLAALAFASVALACATTMGVIGCGGELAIAAWFALCYAVVWIGPGSPRSHRALNGAVQVAAVVVVVLLGTRLYTSFRMGSPPRIGEGDSIHRQYEQYLAGQRWQMAKDELQRGSLGAAWTTAWPVLRSAVASRIGAGKGGFSGIISPDLEWQQQIPIILVVLQALRALIVNTPAATESFLFGGLILGVYCSVNLDWRAGTVFLSGFLTVWLAALAMFNRERVLAARVGPADRVARAGTASVVRAAVRFGTLTAGMGLVLAFAFEGSTMRIAGRMAGFLDRDSLSGGGPPMTADLLAIAKARTTDEILYRIQAPPSIYRFRTQAFADFSEHDWANAPGNQVLERVVGNLASGRGTRGMEADIPGNAFEVTITAARSDRWTIPVPYRVAEVGGSGEALMDGEGGVYARDGFPAGNSYVVRGIAPDWTMALSVESDLTGGPFQPDPRYLVSAAMFMESYVTEATATAPSNWFKAYLIAEKLRADVKYQPEFTWGDGLPGYQQTWHLTTSSRRGNCMNFATALVLLARLAGVPARLATGFIAHGRDPVRGEWLIRDTDGHAWAEVWVGRLGWVPLDPTDGVRSDRPAMETVVAPLPPDAERGIWSRATDLVRRAQPERFVFIAQRYIRDASPSLLAVFLLAWLLRILVRRRRRMIADGTLGIIKDTGDAGRAYLMVCAAAGRVGHPRDEAQTPCEYTGSLASIYPAVQGDLGRLGLVYTGAAYCTGLRPGPDPAIRAIAGRIVKAVNEGRGYRELIWARLFAPRV